MAREMVILKVSSINRAFSIFISPTPMPPAITDLSPILSTINLDWRLSVKWVEVMFKLIRSKLGFKYLDSIPVFLDLSSIWWFK
jgi:hypothetical protein